MPRRDLDGPDPEFGERAPAPAAGAACCDNGWITVKASYARHLHPDPAPLPLDATEADVMAYDELVRRVQVLRRSAEGSVYPCREHRPTQFYRWAQRHFAPDHDPRACQACIETPAAAGRKR